VKNKNDALLAGLTSDQLDAVTSSASGSLRIAAGAGSGKTEVLTRRIVSILDSGIAANRVVAITYTKKAAAEMKSRLVERRKIGWGILRDLKVATFHAFLGDFIKSDPFGAGIDRSDSVVPENDRQLLLADLKEKFANLHGAEIINGPEALGAAKASKLIDEFPRALGMIRRFLLKPSAFYQLSRKCFENSMSEVDQLEIKTLEWLFRFYTYFVEELQKRNLLDFDEILIKGRDLITDLKELNDLPTQNVFLIDEFQDNNPEQLQITRFFTDTTGGHITVVGDEKQSIYRFQGADISAFRNFDSDSDIILKENFRSYKQIINLADRFLEKAGVQSKLSQPQLAVRRTSVREPAVTCLLSGEEDSSSMVCYQLVSFIKEIVDSGMTITDANTDNPRPVKYGDIAIILNSIKNLPPQFEDCLAELQIPYLLSGGFSFYARSEIEEVIAFLRLLLQPDDDYATTKILTGGLYGLNDSDLAHLSLAGRNENTPLLPHILALPESELPVSLLEFRRLFLQLKLRSSNSGLLDLCHYILEQAGFYEYAYAQASQLKQRRMLNNLNKFLAIVRSFEQKGIFTSLRDFILYLEKMLLSGIDEDEAGLGLEEGDAVKIMTIHKSKGLEFPVVFCPFLKGRSYKARGRIFFDPDYGLMVVDPQNPGRKNFGSRLARFIEFDQQASEAEDRRKLYVAFTRARDLLILSGEEKRSFFGEEDEQGKNKKAAEPIADIREIIESEPGIGKICKLNEWQNVLESWLEQGQSQKTENSPIQSENNNLEEIRSELKHLAEFLKDSENNFFTIEKPVEDLFSLQDLELYRQCPRKYFFTRNHVSSFIEKELNTQVLAGTLFHETVRIFHQREGHSLSDVTAKERLIEVIYSDLTDLYGDEGVSVRPRLKLLLNSYLRSELSSIKPWMQEAEVNIKFGASSGPFYLRGYADRVDRNEAEVKIIDFKTRSFSALAHASYSDQMALYLIGAARGVLGQTGCLNFASGYIAYINQSKIELHELKPDLIDFERRAAVTVDLMRKEQSWNKCETDQCEGCGFAVFCHS
jgi:DNA helicase-2/ATP-dependent DNA helicase PcrA